MAEEFVNYLAQEILQQIFDQANRNSIGTRTESIDGHTSTFKRSSIGMVVTQTLNKETRLTPHGEPILVYDPGWVNDA
ncbi:hypothetical protein HY490_04545 [Candidatus Woesearchaeota archaeon]|nr:hypothetical protein [Candidatus Woesearchaeota archaeon]